MALSLQGLLKREIKKMISGIGFGTTGNIFPLITQVIEREIIKVTLEETKGNHVRTARILGISRSTLYRKIETLDIEVKK